MAEAANPFAQFLAPPEEPKAAAEGPNPFAQFVPGADVSEPTHRPEEGHLPSRVVHVTEEGFPIFENEEDNRAARGAVASLFKGIPRGIVQGIGQIPLGIAELGAKGAEAVLPEGSRAKEFMTDQRRRVQQEISQSEKNYQAGRGDAADFPDVGRVIGNVAMTAPLAALVPGAAAPGLLARMGAGAVAGGMTAAANPIGETQDGDFWGEKGRQTAAGTVGGGIAPAVMGGLARIISPKVNPDVKTLMDAGVTPTPGQILGGSANRIEEAAQSIPLIGDAIKAARARAVGDFNRASVNRALEPIGESLGKGTAAGREAITEMGDKIGSAYDKLVPSLRVQADTQFIHDLTGPTGLNALRAKMSDPAQSQLDRILKNDVFNKFDQNGHMTGEAFKTVESELGRQARKFSGSPVAADRDVGEALTQLQRNFRQLLTRSNPDKAAELRSINNAFAHGLRVEGAAAKSGTDQGVFTPAHLSQSIKSLDPSLRDKAFARGEAMMQDLSDAGKAVLGSKVPDSGTPLRSIVAGGAPLGALYMVNPLAAGGVAAGGLGVMGAYSHPGVNTLAKLLASRGAWAEPTANLVRNPAISTLPAILAQQRQ